MFIRTKICTGLLLAFGGSLAICALPAVAQQAPADQSSSAAPQRVEITGSSIKRIDGETAAPVQVMKREDIERSGVTSVEQLMQNVASIVSSGSVATASASGATTGSISAISLRGLGSTRTLVLINGKRTSPYGAPGDAVSVDVDSIPVAAIERVEVLKDGASAIYGSDAIAGVVNFILRKDYTGLEVSGSYGAATQDGKGDTTKLSLVGGIGDDRYNVMGVLTYQKDGALYGRDRSFSSTSLRFDHNNATPSYSSDPANVTIGDDFIGSPAVALDGSSANCGPRSVYSPQYDPVDPVCLFDTAPYVALLPDIQRFGVQLTGHYNVSDAAQIYADFSWTRKKVQTTIQPSPMNSGLGIPFNMDPSNPYYPTDYVKSVTGDGTTPTIGVYYRPFVIGERALTDTANSYRAVAGVQGTAVGWDYDADVLWSESKVVETLNSGYFRIWANPSDHDADPISGSPAIEDLIDGKLTNNGVTEYLNPFGDSDPFATAYAQSTNFHGTAFTTKPSITELQVKASRDLMPLSGGSLALALGAEGRREGYSLDSSPDLATGNISGYGGNFVGVDTNRTVFGLFGELDAPFTKQFDLDAAVRYDRYQSVSNPLTGQSYLDSVNSTLDSFTTVGGTTNNVLTSDQRATILSEIGGDAPSFGKATGKLGGRFKVSEQFLLRGTVSTGFRAPALTDLFGPLQSGVTAVMNDPKNCTPGGGFPYCGQQFNEYDGGNAQLKPETSLSKTLGFVVEPTKSISIGADYFDTHVKNMIVPNDPAYMLQHEDQYAAQINRAANGQIVAIDGRLVNLGEVHISGLDIDAQTRFTLPFGRLGLAWSGTYMTKWNSENPDGTWSGEIGQTSSDAGGFIPRFRHTTSVSLATGPWTLGLDYNWESGATDVCGNLEDADTCTPPHVSPYETLDAQIAWTGIKNLQLALGARNLFDHDPPYVNGAGGAFQAGYDPTVADPRGRYAYLTATYKFK